jgi:hypothetical protein
LISIGSYLLNDIGDRIEDLELRRRLSEDVQADVSCVSNMAILSSDIQGIFQCCPMVTRRSTVLYALYV